MRRRGIVGAVPFLVLLAGCTAHSGVVPMRLTTPPPVVAESVAVLDRQPSQPYEVLGRVWATNSVRLKSPLSLVPRLRAEAAKLGADAVLVTFAGEPQSGVVVGPYGAGAVHELRVEGLAIRWTP